MKFRTRSYGLRLMIINVTPIHDDALPVSSYLSQCSYYPGRNSDLAASLTEWYLYIVSLTPGRNSDIIRSPGWNSAIPHLIKLCQYMISCIFFKGFNTMNSIYITIIINKNMLLVISQ